MSYLECIKPYQSVDLSNHLPFYIGDERIGWIQKPFIEHLKQFSDTFEIDNVRVLLSNNLTNFDDRSAAIKGVLDTLVRQGIVKPNPYGPHNSSPALQKIDVFSLGPDPFNAPLVSIERYYIKYFGAQRHNVSAIGYIDDHIWLARRSSQVDFPNMLDQTVGGGCSMEYTLLETLADEAYDEAGISEGLIKTARSLGSFDLIFNGKKDDIFHETLNMFDIVLPSDFTPQAKFLNEISDFQLMSFDEVNNEILNKDNIAPLPKITLIYFLIKQKYISEKHKEYDELIAAFDYNPATDIAAY